MRVSRSQIDAFRRNLIKLNPPEEILWNFDNLCRIAVEIESEDTLEELLKDECKKFNWTAPWETAGIRLTFRARLLGHDHPEYKPDTGGENTPAEEQCYRRGYDQGFHHALEVASNVPGAKEALSTVAEKVHRWRVARLHSRDTLISGDIEELDYPCIVRSTARRSGLSLSKRFTILQRDGSRCKVCGNSAALGAVLEVDHIIPVSDGGTDDMANLQTLCFDCNRGKSNRS